MMSIRFAANSNGNIISNIINYLENHPEDTQTQQLFEVCEYQYSRFRECKDRLLCGNPELRDSRISGDSEYQMKMMDCAESIQNLIERWRHLNTKSQTLKSCA